MEVNSLRCEILGYLCGVVEVFALLECYAASVGDRQLTKDA